MDSNNQTHPKPKIGDTVRVKRNLNNYYFFGERSHKGSHVHIFQGWDGTVVDVDENLAQVLFKQEVNHWTYKQTLASEQTWWINMVDLEVI